MRTSATSSNTRGSSRVPHLDQRAAEDFERPHGRRGAEPLGLARGACTSRLRELDDIGRHRNEERVAQPGHESFGEAAHVGARRHRRRDSGEGSCGVAVGERIDEVFDRRAVIGHRARCHDLVEC